MRWQDIGWISASVVVLGLFGTATMLSASAFRARTAAPCSGQTTAHTVVLLDRTDVWQPAQTAQLQAAVSDIEQHLKVGERLTIATIDAGHRGAGPLFSECRPDDGATASWGNSNPAMLHKAFQRLFERPLSASIVEATKPGVAPASPILETVAAVMNTPDFGVDVKDRVLVLGSDMLQNTGSYSQYRPPIDFEAFSRSKQAKALAVPMNGVTVRILYIMHHGAAAKHQGADHIAFWTTWFEDLGATVSVERLE